MELEYRNQIKNKTLTSIILINMVQFFAVGIIFILDIYSHFY